MINLLKYSTLALAAALSLSTFAHAWDGDHDKHHDPDQPRDPKSAPEVDPSLALGGFTLLAGTLTVVRSRRRR
jgi:hypothetical protein